MKILVVVVGRMRGDLTDVNFEQADLRGADMRGANLTGANLCGANLTNAKLADANLTRTRMDGAIGTHGQRIGAAATGVKKKPKRPWWQIWS